MKVLKTIFALEGKKIWCKRNLIIFLVLLVLLSIFLQDGVNEYKKILENKKIFQEMEKKKVEQYVLITQYGAYGIRVMFIPDTFSILFNNSGLFSELVSNVDVGERLNIYNTLKGRQVFDEPGGFMDFSGILLLFGAFLGLLYGYDAFRNEDHLKLSLSISSHRKLFFPIIFSRIILFNLFFLILAFISVLVPFINGINLYNQSFLLFDFVLLLVTSFFILCGSITGTFKNKAAGFSAMMAVFFIACFLIPWFINKIVRINAGSLIPNYKVELEKLKIIMSFEKKFLKEAGRFKSVKDAPDNVKKLIKSYIDNEYKKILKKEENAKTEIIDKISDCQYITASFPTTFYFSAGFEFSSRGYLNFIDFYKYNQELKDGFFKYYIKRKYYAPTAKVESYIKNNKNLFQAKSRIPGNFIFGALLHIFYIAILLWIAYFRFKKFLFPVPEKSGAFNALDLNLKKGNYITIDANKVDFKNQILNVFSGKCKGFKGKLFIEENCIVNIEKKDFFYLHNPDKLPGDITVNAFLAYLKGMLDLTNEEMNQFDNLVDKGDVRLGELNTDEKAKLMLTAAGLKNSDTYILYDFQSGLSQGLTLFVKEWIKNMKKRGALILDIYPSKGMFLIPDYQTIFEFDGEKYIEHRVKNYGGTVG